MMVPLPMMANEQWLSISWLTSEYGAVMVNITLNIKKSWNLKLGDMAERSRDALENDSCTKKPVGFCISFWWISSAPGASLLTYLVVTTGHSCQPPILRCSPCVKRRRSREPHGTLAVAQDPTSPNPSPTLAEGPLSWVESCNDTPDEVANPLVDCVPPVKPTPMKVWYLN